MKLPRMQPDRGAFMRIPTIEGKRAVPSKPDREWLDAITARAAAATEGPWRNQGRMEDEAEHGYPILGGGPDGSMAEHMVGWVGEFTNKSAEADAEFIAAARTDVKWLCDRVRDLTAENGRLIEAVSDNRWWADKMTEQGNTFLAERDAAVARADDLTQRLDAARDWLRRVDPHPQLNGDKFAELRAALDGGAAPTPQDERAG